MPSYRGVDQAQVVQSLKDAVAFLTAHTTGPHLDEHLSFWSQADDQGLTPIARIEAATDDKSLVEAIRETGVQGNLCWIAELIYFHAENDTNGRGAGIANNLHAWDAASGARIAVYTPVDGEIDDYIEAHKQPAPRRLKALWNRLVKRQPAEESAPANRQPAPRAMDRYGIVVEGLKEGKINWTDPSITALRQQTDKVMEPFYELDEVGMSGIGLLGDSSWKCKPEDCEQGLMYECTRRAAQALADAFPGMKVIDGAGQILPPQKPAPEQTQKPKPPGGPTA